MCGERTLQTHNFTWSIDSVGPRVNSGNDQTLHQYAAFSYSSRCAAFFWNISFCLADRCRSPRPISARVCSWYLSSLWKSTDSFELFLHNRRRIISFQATYRTFPPPEVVYLEMWSLRLTLPGGQTLAVCISTCFSAMALLAVLDISILLAHLPVQSGPSPMLLANPTPYTGTRLHTPTLLLLRLTLQASKVCAVFPRSRTVHCIAFMV